MTLTLTILAIVAITIAQAIHVMNKVNPGK